MEPAHLPKRFELVRQLGRGGMGEVYEAIDHEYGGRVAIKTIRETNVETIARFKREFRALQDVRHPNLVTLGELFCEDGRWAFSMDLIEGGVDFVTYVQSGSAPGSGGPRLEVASTLREIGEGPVYGADEVTLERSVDAPRVGGGFDVERLRAALVQLASGLDALHAANKVHRDIKPSNIMVSPTGHVTILDFGLVADLDLDESRAMAVVGTPRYMSPEQAAASRQVGPPSDWYSVGVMLYVVLTGRYPFDGPPMQVLIAKQTTMPPAPHVLVPGVSRELDGLCMRLLATEPRDRPAGRDLLRELLSGDDSSAGPATQRQTSNLERTFVGRGEALEKLELAFRGTMDGRAGCVLVEGESGIGKSYLVGHFIERLKQLHPSLVVLSGRCYEKESVPYKAFDAVVDSLVRYLMDLPRADAAALLPTQLAPLMQTFPALQRVEVVARQVKTVSSKMDPLEIRSRAFTALREMFERIAQRAPLVVAIDDLQWSDRDSMGLLAEIVRDPEPPPLLLLATARPTSEANTANTQGADFRAVLPRETATISLLRLPDTEATELAARLLSRAAPDRMQSAATIAEEAGGHALFIAELVHYGAAQGPGAHRKLRLEDLVSARVAQLDAPARRLLTLLCVAGTPMPAAVLSRAAAVPPGALAGVLSDLRAAHFIRTATIDGFDSVEPYHDRVRDAVLGTTDEAGRTTAYEQLAFALQGSKHADAKRLAELWHGAGDLERAGEHALQAGHQAAEAFAFDRAATYYQWALERPSCTGSDRQRLTVLVAETLAKGGRGAQAAAAFQRAAQQAEPAEALDLERRAADQLLRVGHFDAGLAAVQMIVARVGLDWPKTPFRALLAFVLLRVWRAVRGYGFRKRDPMHAVTAERLRLDVCWTVSTGLGMCDNIRAAVFQQRYVSLALRSGDARRISLGLSYECAFRGGYGGEAAWPTTARYVARAVTLAEETGDPFCRGFGPICVGTGMFMSGHFREALEPLDRGQALLRSDCPGTTWELVSQQLFTVSSLFWLGEGRALLERQPIYLREATERGDVYGIVQMSIGLASFVWLLLDDPATARERVEDAMRRWGSNWGYRVEDYLAVLARANADLYEGITERPLARVDADWSSFERSMLRRIPLIRVTTSHLRGRVRLARAEASSERRAELLRDAEADAEQLARGKSSWSPALAELLFAGADAVRGDDQAAEAHLRRSVVMLEKAEIGLFAAAARRALGKMVKGDEGSALVKEAEDRMRGARIRNIAAIGRCLAPGFGRLE